MHIKGFYGHKLGICFNLTKTKEQIGNHGNKFFTDILGGGGSMSHDSVL